MCRRIILTLGLLCAALGLSSAQTASFQDEVDSTAVKLMEAGFVNVRVAETPNYKVYTIENDRYKLPAEGFAEARKIIESASIDKKAVKLIGTHYDVPELTMTYFPHSEYWHTTKRLDESWDEVRKTRKLNSNFGKVNIAVYPQVSLMNLIINQVYQSLWQLSPAIEVSLWPGMKFTYQLKIPIYNDGYGILEDKVHPGMMSLSQRFRDPWNLNVIGKLTAGTFSNSRYGAALEMAYHFPNERFWVDTQMAYLSIYSWDAFKWYYGTEFNFVWNFSANYYNPSLKTQFILRAQKFLLGDYGVKYEMIRHFKHASVGLYAVKGIDPRFDTDLNVGFRFQIALPPYRHKRHGYIPRISVSPHMGMSYNANNEQIYYKEFRTETTDNIMSNNAFNPYYVSSDIFK